MYTDFAQVYDALMRDVDYAAWAAFYDKLLIQNGMNQNASIVECACGTGSITLELCAKGYRMTGIDLSQQMLSIAMKKARDKGYTVPFICQDMAKLSLGRRADAILATCDGLNYLHAEKVARFFDRASFGLRSGGMLLFDVSTPWKLQSVLGNNTLTCNEEDFSYIWENEWNDHTQTVKLLVTAFVKRKDGLFFRTCEEQTQFAHSLEFLHTALRNAGFTEIQAYSGQSLQNAKQNDERWHITALKP